MQKVRDVTCPNPTAQVWKYLRFFLDISNTVKKIKEINNIQDSKLDRNIEKQAKEISYAILQAEEYYKASEQVSLATKPLLLYYGSVALSQALILLFNDGEVSCDFRRKKDKHQHHGLELKGFSFPSDVSKLALQDILERIQCNIYLNYGSPWGQFGLFYKTLIPSVFKISLKTRQIDNSFLSGKPKIPMDLNQLEREFNQYSSYIENFVPQSCADLVPIDSIESKVFNCFDLSTLLPDCFFTLQELEVKPKLC